MAASISMFSYPSERDFGRSSFVVSSATSLLSEQQRTERTTVMLKATRSTLEWSRPSERNANRASLSIASLPSVSSMPCPSAGGGEIKPLSLRRKASWEPSSQTMPAASAMNRNVKKNRLLQGGESMVGNKHKHISVSLALSLRSAPMVMAGRRKALTSKNEDWDRVSLAQHLLHEKNQPLTERRAKPAAPPKAKKRVTFDADLALIGRSEGSEWHSDLDSCESFRAASEQAERINRSMRYAANVERTHSSATGLVAPRALGEYLSCPEEVVGLEHALDGQSVARSSLQASHARALADEQSRQRGRGAGADPSALAERLANGSSISAHMARERATYASLLG